MQERKRAADAARYGWLTASTGTRRRNTARRAFAGSHTRRELRRVKVDVDLSAATSPEEGGKLRSARGCSDPVALLPRVDSGIRLRYVT